MAAFELELIKNEFVISHSFSTMRHLEPILDNLGFKDKHGDMLEIKEEDLQELVIKEEYIHMPLDDGLVCNSTIKENEFSSDEDDGHKIEIPISPTISSPISSPSPNSKSDRRTRRKPLQPQRAMQSDSSQSYAGNSSECSQEATTTEDHEDSLEEEEELLEGDDAQDLNSDNIFKELQEEALEGEELDEETQRNVEEEWRAHWGVKCNMCEQVFPHKSEFDKHYQHTYNLQPIYTCSYCNKSMDKYSTFRSHCYRHITEGRYKCPNCPKGFSLRSMLTVHVLAKHTKAKPFVCDECGKCFVTKPGLKIHAKKHQVVDKEDYPCVECGKILHTRGGLTVHMNVHRLGRRFMCDICGKTFTQKVNMQQHVKQHTGEKPYGCDKCGKGFAEKSHLARHYSFHSDTRPYKCDVCQKMYKTERCLKVHRLVHAAERPYVCAYCSKGFLSSTKLKQHYNIHTGERPYACKYCERTFTNYPNWLKHTRRRHKVDHRTGVNLELKEEPQTPNPPNPVEIIQPASPVDQQLLFDYSFARTTEDLLLSQTPQPTTQQQEQALTSHHQQVLTSQQQQQVNFLQLHSLGDDKFIIPQQLDFLTNTGVTTTTTMSLMVPYVQPCIQQPLPAHQALLQDVTLSNNGIYGDHFVHSQLSHMLQM